MYRMSSVGKKSNTGSDESSVNGSSDSGSDYDSGSGSDSDSGSDSASASDSNHNFTINNTDNNDGFDIANFSIKQLFEVIGMNDDSKYLSKDIIQRRFETMKKNVISSRHPFYKQYTTMNFLKEAEDKLCKYMDSVNTSTGTTDDSSQPVGKKLTSLTTAGNLLLSSQSTISKIDPALVENSSPITKVTTQYNVPLARDSINPIQRHIYTKVICLNSEVENYFIDVPRAQTNTYSFTLEERLKNVVELKLHSIQIPDSWYTIDAARNNNTFSISIPNAAAGVDTSANDTTYSMITITIPDGNYTEPGLIDAVNSLCSANQTLQQAQISVDFSMIPIQQKIQIKVTPDDDSFTGMISFVFCEVMDSTTQVNATIGWMLGFREVVYDLNVNPQNDSPLVITGEAIFNVHNVNYIYINVDDYNQNHIHNSVVGVTEYNAYPSKSVRDPFSRTMQFNSGYTNANMEKYMKGISSGDYNMQIIPDTENRQFSQNELFAMQQTMKTKHQAPLHKLQVRSPTTRTTFATLSAPNIGPVVYNPPATDVFKRTYFGPVDLVRLKITLLDDKGLPVILNGNNWTCLFEATLLYQYGDTKQDLPPV